MLWKMLGLSYTKTIIYLNMLKSGVSAIVMIIEVTIALHLI